MPIRQSVIDHTLDRFRLLPPVEPRRMFGGVGFFLEGRMFALLDKDELFLKTDEQSKAPFEEAGCRAWVYTGRSRPMKTLYFHPPEEAFEEAEAMLPWAKLAIETARRALAAKPKKRTSAPGSKKASKRAPRVAQGR